MKIEFYSKETNQVCYWQNIYLVDAHGSVFEDLGKHGLLRLNNIGWRIVE